MQCLKSKLQFIPDPDMYAFFDKKESNNIIYSDASNLYGYAMPKFCPTSGFKWIDPKEFDLNKYTNNSSKRCVIEVDLEYRK